MRGLLKSDDQIIPNKMYEVEVEKNRFKRIVFDDNYTHGGKNLLFVKSRFIF